MPTGKFVPLFMNVAKFFKPATDCNKMCISCAKVETPTISLTIHLKYKSIFE
jgi:hypothetical protein